MRASEFMALPAVFHAIKRAVRGANSFSRRVPVLGIRGDAGADRQGRIFGFRRQPLANAGSHTQSNVPWKLPEGTSANSSPPYRAAVSIAS